MSFNKTRIDFMLCAVKIIAWNRILVERSDFHLGGTYYIIIICIYFLCCHYIFVVKSDKHL